MHRILEMANLIAKILLIAFAATIACKPSRAQQGISNIKVGAFDSSKLYEVQCGVEREACKVGFGQTAIEISDGSKINFSSILDSQAGELASVECAKEQPALPYETQSRGFPCWSGTSSYYVLIAHKSPEGARLISAFSFKNQRVVREFAINVFAARSFGAI